MNQPISLARARDIKHWKDYWNIISLEEAIDFIQNEKSVSMDKLVKLYDNTAVHVREDLRGLIANDSSIPSYRKSIFFQVVHFVDHRDTQDELSIEMILALYYGMKSDNRKMEIDRLVSKFIGGRLVSTDQLKDLVMSGLWVYPYKLTGNERTQVFTTMEVEFIKKRRLA